MNKQDDQSKKSFSVSSIFTGMVVGFLAAAVLYQKHFPDWVPGFLHDNPFLFFSIFILICGFLGYVWVLPEDKNG
ncbi:hypothetical protein JW979_00610 [bacterium]|nr:hypothetical protein [candidate division CSSED10-310 bacterium]